MYFRAFRLEVRNRIAFSEAGHICVVFIIFVHISGVEVFEVFDGVEYIEFGVAV